MGLFNLNNEEMWKVYGYVYGAKSRMIYHVPNNDIYEFPNITKGLSQIAIQEMRISKPYGIIVPGSFKKFNYEFINFEELKFIELQEGVEEVKCVCSKKDVDIKLPSTIKKIGANNYPIAQDLVLPNGVIEIEKMFASHDTNLISVNIPGTLKVIPLGAFNQCKNLQTVILNEGVETAMLDSFRGTNSLKTLVLPSTFNGAIALSMDPRAITSVRGNSKYDSKRFEEDQNAILNIKITRDDKVFDFNIKRKEQPTLSVRRNIIIIKCSSQQQMITIDSNQLQSGTYNIENGILKQQQSFSFEQKEENDVSQQNKNIDLHEQEMMDKLDIIFQNAYREHVTKRDDFIRLSSATKMQIKKVVLE